jgi:gliding motility-associated-like protein
MLHVEILAEPNLTNNTNGIACVAFPTTLVTNGLVLDSGVANPSNYTFTWYKNNTIIVGATGSTYTITNMDAATDTYKVMATSISSLACNSAISNEITITRSSAPSLVGEGYVLSNYFEDNQTLTILVNGYSLATYLFQLDNGPKQISNVFTNVSAGVHTVTVYDPTSDDVCGTLELTGINAVNYPHYFTPNGDGYNDRWQIVGLEDQPEAKVMIFDRYGKLVKQISTTGAGWDGTFNGNPLPATDYWFAIEYIENNQQKTFKAHFALKR